jgi:hypothetical protein
LLRHIRRSFGVGLSVGAASVVLSALASGVTAPAAAASTTQLSMFEIPGIATSLQDPAPTLQILRSLGVNILRVGVYWSDFAPDPNSRVRPNFNAADPSAYPATNWLPLDLLVRDAQADGIQLDFEVTGSAPLWATQAGGPPCDPNGGWCYGNVYEPSASEFGEFVQAVATRYPSVHFWELWNEANWGPSLVPQYLGSSVPVSAGIYRGLLDAGWTALQATGHGADTIVVTSLSQDGSSTVGETGTTAPLTFIRTLWCADPSYAHLSGAAASEAGCPTTAAGYQQFKAANPALFEASGVGVHPYPYGHPPTYVEFPSPDGAEFAEIPQLTTALDRLQRLYTPSGPYKQMAAYNTEYGYRTRPNDTASFFATPDEAAAYINEAEFMSWKNPRIATYDQYELQDGGWFPTGLFFAPQTAACPGMFPCAKPSFAAYRFPVWLPITQIPRGQATEVWGNARPAYFARLDTGRAQSVQIQWAPGSSGQFQTVATVQTSALGYLDTQVKFPGNGQVRLAWEYPPGDAKLLDPLDPSPWIYSRVTNISFYRHSATGYLRGVFQGRTKLGLTLKKGANAPLITAVSVRAPRGLKLSCFSVKRKKHASGHACTGLTVRGGKVRRVAVSHGVFLLDLARPASRLSITAVAPFVKVSGSRSRLRKGKKVPFTLLTADANGATSTLALKVRVS